MSKIISPTKRLTLDSQQTDSWMFAAARDLPKRPTHIQTHIHPLSSADVSVVGRETNDKRQREMEIKKIQITLLSELCGLVIGQTDLSLSSDAVPQIWDIGK